MTCRSLTVLSVFILVTGAARLMMQLIATKYKHSYLAGFHACMYVGGLCSIDRLLENLFTYVRSYVCVYVVLIVQLIEL